MKNGMAWKRVVLALFLAVVLAAGCSKKQTVQSGDASGAAPGAGAPTAASPGAGAIGETPVTESPAQKESPATLARAAEAGVAVTQEQPSRFPDVLFDFDKADLREDGKRTCQAVAEFLRQNPKARLLIEGHCDERGTPEYNLALGERRAVAVRNYILSLGIPKGVLSTVSFGEERPLDPGHTEEAWAKNRRAHFVTK
jgi:peptidoglycan-associated lipoprotein